MKNKLNYKKLIAVIIFVIFLIIFIFSVFKIIKWNLDNKANKEIEDILNISIEKPQIEDDIKDNDEIIESEYNIDFEALKKRNKDIVAYLNVPNTNVDTTVVRGKNNSYYLNHNFDKKWNNCGWAFADYRNRFDGSDRNIVIFGHNLKNKRLFGSLKNTLNKKWYTNKENQIITLVTEKEEAKYQVFSIYTIPKEEYYIKTSFNSDNEYNNFLNTIKKRSIYDFKVPLNSNDTILTLSTCQPGGSERLAFHAKKLNE